MTASPPPELSLTGDEPERIFSSLERATGILAAVSGGPDSIALMHLLARWSATAPRPRIVVATVDHGLRREAAEESAFVAHEAKALGLAHRALVWTGPKPKTGIQESAREARYRLLVDCAREEGASHLVTAHTQDDQAETVLMRMARGSGLTGLRGMRRERDRAGICHARPLLEYPKETLLDLCRRENWPFVTDPSNADDRYARIRWRKLMPALAAEGLTAERLARLADRLAQAEDALDAKAREALARSGPQIGENGLVVNALVLSEEPFEIALRLLVQALAKAEIPLQGVRLQRLEACAGRLREAARTGKGLRLTIAGALIQLDRSGRLAIRPEPPRRRGR